MIVWIALGMLYLLGMLSTINTVHAKDHWVFPKGQREWLLGSFLMLAWPATAVFVWFVLNAQKEHRHGRL